MRKQALSEQPGLTVQYKNVREKEGEGLSRGVTTVTDVSHPPAALTRHNTRTHVHHTNQEVTVLCTEKKLISV
ncbi:hypothetical protein AAFF_G00426500 [Aldrovandia affinis]|uniref:Uncharacterized protein n=1 Tax=Aldrovandia affinis TaxID=143900 RepID=A0AAD7S9E8_9TELE|nr:hypothetical protein AAFF_G00426500 [Aldrovandia affinis]